MSSGYTAIPYPVRWNINPRLATHCQLLSKVIQTSEINVRSVAHLVLAFSDGNPTCAFVVDLHYGARGTSAVHPAERKVAVSDPSREHSFLALFPSGTYIPILDYTVQKPVESQYDTTVVVAEYDFISDFPDRPSNLLTLANAVIAGALVHTPAAWISPTDVTPENITTTTNSRDGTTTTYFIPTKQLPLTEPLRMLGVPNDVTDQIDQVLRPMVDEGYSRNDDPSSPATGLDLAGGADLGEALDSTHSRQP